MPRIQQQPAYVLHARAYRETSQLVELLTRDLGRVALVARGTKRPKSRLRNILQPFRPLLVSWSGKGDLGTLTGAEQIAAPPSIHGEALFCAMYMNELLTRLLHRHDPHPDVFERYSGTLSALASGSPPEPDLRLFEKHLLEATGYALILDHEAGSDRAIAPDRNYDYRPDRGPVLLSSEGQGGNRSISGKALLALKAEQLNDEFLPELRSLMRRVIGYHLGDKPLASRALFGGIRRDGTVS